MSKLLAFALFFIPGLTLAAEPLTLNLTWEAAGALPPLYAGHSQVVPGGRVKVIALTNTDPSQIDFEWQKDGQAIGSASGRGGQTLTYTADAGGRASQVSVTAGGVTKNLTITPQLPLVRLYENEPALGLNYFKAFTGRYNLEKPALTLVAEPYFFPLNSNLAWEWRLEGKKVIDNVSRPFEITLAPPTTTNTILENELVAQVTAGESGRSAEAKLTIGFGGNQTNF
jgi:hypothetical protein